MKHYFKYLKFLSPTKFNKQISSTHKINFLKLFAKLNHKIIVKKKVPTTKFLNKDPSLLINPPQKTQLSGLLFINKQEKIYSICETVPEFHFAMLKIKCLMMYLFYSNKHFKDDLFTKIENCLAIKISQLNLQNTNVLEYVEQKEIALKQHFFNIFLLNKKFPIESLKKMFPGILFTTKKQEVNTNLWFELFISDRCLNLNELCKKINIEIIDAENSIFQYKETTQNINIYKMIESQKQVGQPFSDIHLYKMYASPSHLNKGIEIQSFYKDVKASFQGPLKGHLIIKNNFTDEKQITHYILNTLTVITDKLKELKNKKLKERLTRKFANLRKDYDSINDIQTALKNFNTKLIELSFSSEIKEADINITIMSNVDNKSAEDDLLIYKKILENLPAIKEEKLSIRETHDFHSSMHDSLSMKKNVLKIIELMPKELQNECVTNIEQFLEI